MIAAMLQGPGHRWRRVVTAAAALLLCSTGIAVASDPTIPRSSAKAVAQAISLRPSDVPTLTAQSNPITTQELRGATEAAICEGRYPPRDAFALGQSDRFVGTGGQPLVLSTSTIMPSAAMVAHDLVALRGAKEDACFARVLAAQTSATLPKNETIVSTSTTRFTPPVSGTDEAYAVHIVVGLRIKQGTATTTVDFDADAIGFGLGQAEIGLEVASVSAPPPLSLERRLAALLVARAHAAIN